MRLKYSELLAAKRELVLPLHLKHLIQVGSMLDECLSFLIQCRKQNVGAVLTFNELKQSVERTHGKTVTTNHFRQLLTLSPELYNHSWEKVAGSPAPQLTVEFGPVGEPNTLYSAGYFEKRKQELRSKVIDYSCAAYRDFVAAKFTQAEVAASQILADPVKA
jgi:hypothetical protein